MSDQISIGDLHFLFFVIPGFVTVWSYRYATYSEKKGDFELLGLSFFWGIFIAGIVGFLPGGRDSLTELFKNPYSVTLAFSTLGSLFAFLISLFKEKSRIMNFLEKAQLVWFVIKKRNKKK